MGNNAKALTGYADGFFGPDNFPVKFTYASAFGFLISQVGMNKVQLWLDQYYYTVSNTAKGWGEPFFINKNPINGGVGTIASVQPYNNLIRARVNQDGDGFTIKRGLEDTKSAVNTCEWVSSDFKQYVSWKGHSSRYGPSYYADSHITEGLPFVQGQTVTVRLSTQVGGVTRVVTIDGQETSVNGRWGLPMVATRTSYRDEEYFWDGHTFEYVQGDVPPPDIGFTFDDKVYLNGGLICKVPIEDNRAASTNCGQEGLVQGACIRNAPPDLNYYSVMDVDPPETEDWVTAITHEWWLEDATLCKVEVLTDRVYTMPLRAAKGVNPGVADDALIADLAGQIIGLNPGAEQDELKALYAAEYSKWRLIAEFETDKEPLPATFELHQPFYYGYAEQGCLGENPSPWHWLFSASGKKAMQRRTYDPLIEYDAGVRHANILREIVLTDEAIPTATMGFADAETLEDAMLTHAVVATDSDNASGKMLLAADYKGETLVVAYAEGSTDGYSGVSWVVDYKMILPWTIGEELIGMYSLADGNQIVMVVNALDLRYDFICYGMYIVDYGPFQTGDYICTYHDWIIESDGLPVQISPTYTSSQQNSFYAEFEHDALEWCRVYSSHTFPWTSNGTSVRFLNANTYALTHEIHKRTGAEYEVDGPDWFTPPIQREIDRVGYWYSSPGRGRYTSRVVINGVYAGTLPTLTYSYSPYFGETMHYSCLTLG